jgi:hypothetical protein
MKITVGTLLVALVAALAPVLGAAESPEHQEPQQPLAQKGQQLRGSAAAAARGLVEKKNYRDGKLCINGTPANAPPNLSTQQDSMYPQCYDCLNPATYWYKKAWMACGDEPKWGDGTICALGSTCNACKNAATYWGSKAFTACGTEPACWPKRTLCGIGTTCNNCCSGSYSWKLDQFMTSCD